MKRIKAVVERYPPSSTVADIDVLDELIKESEHRGFLTKRIDETLTLVDLEKRGIHYFGCNEEAGHYMHNVWMKTTRGDPPGFPWKQIDGVLPPQFGKRPGRVYDSARETQGICALHHKDGWTALAFWDRSVDKRGGCNSAFFVREPDKTFDEMIVIAEQAFPRIVARFEFPLVEMVKT